MQLLWVTFPLIFDSVYNLISQQQILASTRQQDTLTTGCYTLLTVKGKGKSKKTKTKKTSSNSQKKKKPPEISRIGVSIRWTRNQEDWEKCQHAQGRTRRHSHASSRRLLWWCMNTVTESTKKEYHYGPNIRWKHYSCCTLTRMLVGVLTAPTSCSMLAAAVTLKCKWVLPPVPEWFGEIKLACRWATLQSTLRAARSWKSALHQVQQQHYLVLLTITGS